MRAANSGTMHRLSLVVVLAAVAAGASASPASAAVVDCDTWASYPNVRISSARGMTCAAATRDMKRYRGNIDRRFRTPGGFACGRVSGGTYGGQWRCVSGSRAYRFEFGD